MSFADAGQRYNVIKMSRVARKPVFGVSNKVLHKPRCTATEVDLSLDILDLERRGLYYLCSENKSYRSTDLPLCFQICKKQIFS